MTQFLQEGVSPYRRSWSTTPVIIIGLIWWNSKTDSQSLVERRNSQANMSDLSVQ
jgi:hypothetical protein